MKSGRWPWLDRIPALLTAPRPEPAERAQRIIRLYRDIVMPAKLVAVAAVFYYIYIYSSEWLGEVATTYRVFFETMQDFFTAYILFTLTVAVTFFVVRRFPPGVVQWVAFTAGLVDGLFLAGLTVLTGGFESILYWIFPALILLNAICIPLATPQIVLNLLLSGLFVGAGLLENSVNDAEISLSPLRRPVRASELELTTRDLRDMGRFFKQSNFVSKYYWELLSPETRQGFNTFLLTGEETPEFKERLTKELKRLLLPPRRLRATEPPEDVASPYVLRLSVLVMLTFCCYGVQVLAAQKRQADEEQKEFIARTAQVRAAGRMAAEFAHQIKNPLAIINNVTFSLQKGLKNGKPELTEQIGIVQEEVAKADRIITQIMGYAQLSEGRVEKLNVIEELDRVIREIFPAQVPTGVVVEREYDGEFPSLLMQRRHFAESIGNLLQNAREALDGQGRVRVRARCLEDYSVEVTVRDSGPGIPPDKQERIFEAYYSTKERGTGLGLAIVKHNVELYGGSVRVESELGKGTAFTLLFPAKTLMNADQ
jgi:signal transduction histidine kinase